MLTRKSYVSLSALVLSIGTVAAAQSLAPTQAAHTTPHTGSRDAAYGKRSMTFEPNLGQTAASVLYLSHGSNYSVLVEPAQATLMVHHEQGTPAQRRKALLNESPCRSRRK